MPESKDRAAEIADKKRISSLWMQSNFYSQWEQVYKSYKAERDPKKDKTGKDDPTQTSIGMPDTWGHVRRSVARNTAQPPNLRFHARDKEIADIISKTLMYQWDKGGVQRLQKKHMLQVCLFGWSVRPWFWANDRFMRNKRINIINEQDPATLGEVEKQYELQPGSLADPQNGQVARAKLLSTASRGGLLPLKYPYTAYTGPRCDFLFVGDCYPEANFQSLQASRYFIVERRRDRQWVERTAKAFPELAPGFDRLLTAYPDGSPYSIFAARDTQDFRTMLEGSINRSTDSVQQNPSSGSEKWTITECHDRTLGSDQMRLQYLGENDIDIGEIPYPYDLDGKFAFTEAILIDDLLCGIGDANARIIRGLQALHDRQNNQRFDLIDTILRPLVGTTNRELYENPDLLKRCDGFRLVLMRSQGDLWVQGEQAAIASAAAGMSDETGIMRMIQLATGESNTSQGAGVDPQQGRTATGARLMAYNQDILAKDQADAFNETSIKADADMMYLLNRSEMSDAQDLDAAVYDRAYSPQMDSTAQAWIRVEPMMFQTDGEVTSEIGSTLADDDDAKVDKATKLWNAALQRPDQFNVSKARDEFLIAMGKGKDLQAWAAPPPPPAPPPEVKTSMSVAAKFELLPAEAQNEILQRTTLIPPAPEQAPPPGMGAPPQHIGSSAPTPLAAQPPPDMGAGALMAARGHTPIPGGEV